MSAANIRRFKIIAEANSSLMARVGTILETQADEAAAQVAAISGEVGVPFTAEEFRDHLKEINNQLSDSDLSGVTGGTGSKPQCFGQGCGGSPPW